MADKIQLLVGGQSSEDGIVSNGDQGRWVPGADGGDMKIEPVCKGLVDSPEKGSELFGNGQGTADAVERRIVSGCDAAGAVLGQNIIGG